MAGGAEIHRDGPDSWRFSGELGFATVGELLRDIDTHGPQLPGVIDLGAVDRTDSAGLAMLIELLRRARGAERKLRFANPPPQLLRLAEANGVESLLNE